jgi:hypothetical protein
LPAFEDLWQRRTSIEVAGEEMDLLGLKDLINAKKMQRDKDWPMIRRLVEQDYFRSVGSENPERIEFWLRELRTPELLSDIVKSYPAAAQLIASSRPVVQAALSSGLLAISQALRKKEMRCGTGTVFTGNP